MTTGVLCMAYGSPASLEEVEPYLRSIIGRDPAPQRFAALIERYRAIGGASPLNQITARQTARVGDVVGLPTAVGMKHWRPTIADAVARLIDDGCDRLIGLALAPHYASMSIGGYERQVEQALADGVRFDMIRSWYGEPRFVSFAARALRDAIGDWTDARVLFTAHSLPARILDDGDPYLEQLMDSARLIAAEAGCSHWEFCFQSASATGEPWLGPDVLERLRTFGAAGGARVVIAPIGFTADHLEILYDVDIEGAMVAAEAGVTMRRTRSPNDDPTFIDALAAVVRRALEAVVA